jgi:glycine/D-amino acid oxidase-like deaminating enzyme
MNSNDITVIGAGLGGLAVAVRLAEEGRRVTCYGDGRDGASLANFGQLHSGAVYAPVLPEVAAACWKYRSRWFGLLAEVDDARHGIGLFATTERADCYLDAWRQLHVPVMPLTSHQVTTALGEIRPTVVAAFALPDITVNTTALRARLIAQAMLLGIRVQVPAECSVTVEDARAVVEVDGVAVMSNVVVLCTGASTPSMLDSAGIKHQLAVSFLSYGYVPGQHGLPLTYWLDDDLLALSPTSNGVNIALPGRSPLAKSSNAERRHLANSIIRHWPTLKAEELVPRRGIVAELCGDGPDPTAQVIDLRAQRDGWGRADNVIVCLPGKWTTAWNAADQVVAILNVGCAVV